MRSIVVYRLEFQKVGPFCAPAELPHHIRASGGADAEAYLTLAQKLLAYVKSVSSQLNLKEPFEDGLSNMSWIYTYGCSSLQTLREWFPVNLQEVERLGFQIVARKVPFGDFKIGRSGKQVAFVISEDSPIVETISIKDFVKNVPHPLA
jgi:hypothetical protein